MPWWYMNVAEGVFGGLFNPTCPDGTLIEAEGVNGGLFNPTCPGGT
jgi:hypothetical protein